MNLSWSAPGPYLTQLPPDQEHQFRSWVAQNKVNFDPNEAYPEYDMRGFYQGMLAGDPHAQTGIDPNDNKMHYSDYWKTPWHPTFSRESKYANPNAPYWRGNKLIDPSGKVLYDDAAPKKDE
jgi:hypothetical protein